MSDGINLFIIKILLTIPALLIGVLKALFFLFEPVYSLWTDYANDEEESA